MIESTPKPTEMAKPSHEIAATNEINETETKEKDTYGFEGAKHELIERYQPQFLAKGGEHIVYEIPRYPNVVIKADMAMTRQIINWNVRHDLPIDTLSEVLNRGVQEYLSAEQKRYAQLKKYFGHEHVPAQRKFVVKVPITEKILTALYEGDPPPVQGHEVQAIVTMQKRAEEVKDPQRLTLVTGYAEEDPALNPEQYQKMTEHLVFGKNPEQKIEKDALLGLQNNKHLKKLLQTAEKDQNLAETLKEIITKCIAYSEATGETLDLAGKDNLVLAPEQGKWNYKLIDALYPGQATTAEKTKIALLNIGLGQTISGTEQNILLNTFNYIRAVNGLAEHFGLEKRINIVPEAMEKDSAGNTDWLSVVGRP